MGEAELRRYICWLFQCPTGQRFAISFLPTQRAPIYFTPLKLSLNVIWEATTGRPSIIDPSPVDYWLRSLFVPVASPHLVLPDLSGGVSPLRFLGACLIEKHVKDAPSLPIVLLDVPPGLFPDGRTLPSSPTEVTGPNIMIPALVYPSHAIVY